MNRIRGSGWLPSLACLALMAACGGESESTPSTGGTGATGGTSGGGTGGSGGTGVPTGGSGGTGGECPPGAGACGGANGSCSLTVVASGKLADPVAPTAKLTGPSIVATDDAFVIGYRDQDGDTLRAAVTVLSDDGTLGSPSVFDLGGCSSVVPTDGTGMAYAGGSGMFVASLPNCGQGAGAVFIPFDSKGSVGQASGPKNAAFDSLTLAQQGSLAPASVANEFDLLYRVSTGGADVVERVLLEGPSFKTTPIAHPFGETGVDFGMVASSTSARVLVGAKGASGLELQLGPKTSDSLQTAGTYALPASPFAALTAWDNRAAALVPTSTGVSWHAFELSGASTAQELGSGSVTMPPPSALALAVLGNQLVVATANPKQISVRRQAGAKTQPFSGLEKTVQLSALGGGASLDAFDGTHIAMAAARFKVAVVWLTRHALAAGQPTGGWALLECNNP